MWNSNIPILLSAFSLFLQCRCYGPLPQNPAPSSPSPSENNGLTFYSSSPDYGLFNPLSPSSEITPLSNNYWWQNLKSPFVDESCSTGNCQPSVILKVPSESGNKISPSSDSITPTFETNPFLNGFLNEKPAAVSTIKPPTSETYVKPDIVQITSNSIGPTAVSPFAGIPNSTPYPGCAAALKCVPEDYCTLEGVISDAPVALTKDLLLLRVPLSECQDPATGIVGKCCRDPNYKDPWPADLPHEHHHEHGDSDVTATEVNLQEYSYKPNGQGFSTTIKPIFQNSIPSSTENIIPISAFKPTTQVPKPIGDYGSVDSNSVSPYPVESLPSYGQPVKPVVPVNSQQSAYVPSQLTSPSQSPSKPPYPAQPSYPSQQPFPTQPSYPSQSQYPSQPVYPSSPSYQPSHPSQPAYSPSYPSQPPQISQQGFLSHHKPSHIPSKPIYITTFGPSKPVYTYYPTYGPTQTAIVPVYRPMISQQPYPPQSGYPYPGSQQPGYPPSSYPSSSQPPVYPTQSPQQPYPSQSPVPQHPLHPGIQQPGYPSGPLQPQPTYPSYPPSTSQQPGYPSTELQKPYPPPTLPPQQSGYPSVYPQQPYPPSSLAPPQPSYPSPGAQKPFSPTASPPPQQPGYPSIYPPQPYPPSTPAPQQPGYPNLGSQPTYPSTFVPQQPQRPEFSPQLPYPSSPPAPEQPQQPYPLAPSAPQLPQQPYPSSAPVQPGYPNQLTQVGDSHVVPVQPSRYPFPGINIASSERPHVTVIEEKVTPFTVPKEYSATCGVKLNDGTTFAEAPWHAIVYSSKNKDLICAAAIISENAVLTAAHCLDHSEADSTEVKIGPKGKVFKVAAIARHAQYETFSYNRDLALLVLREPIQFDSYTEKICLPTSFSQKESLERECYVSTLIKELKPETLKTIPVQVFPYKDCEAKLKNTYLGKYFVLNESFSCVSTPVEDELCTVKTGSPIACNKGDGTYELFGIKSWDLGCQDYKRSAIFSNFDIFWVQNTLATPVTTLIANEKAFLKEKFKGDSLEGVNIQDKPGFGQGYGK